MKSYLYEFLVILLCSLCMLQGCNTIKNNVDSSDLETYSIHGNSLINTNNNILLPLATDIPNESGQPFQMVSISPDGEILSAFTLEYSEQFHWNNNYAIDSTGNIYLAPYFSGPVNFGRGDISARTPLRLGGTMIVKYDPDGTLIWAGDFAGNNTTFPEHLYIDCEDNIYFVGTYDGEIDLDLGEGTDIHTANLIVTNVIAKYAPDSTYIWGYEIGRWGSNDLCMDSEKNIYFVIEDSDETVIVDADLAPLGYKVNSLIYKIDLNGGHVWERTVYNAAMENIACIDAGIDNKTQIIIGGRCLGVTTFDGTDYSISLGSNFAGITFLVSYDSDGEFLWGRDWLSFDGEIEELDVNEDGILITGAFHNYPRDGVIPEGYVYRKDDAYFSRLDFFGNLDFRRTWGGSDSDSGFYILNGNDGEIFITGFCCSDNIDFDSGELFELGDRAGSYITNFNRNGDLCWMLTAHDFQEYFND